MESAPECIPCSVMQVLRTAKMAGVDDATQKKAVRDAMRIVAELDHGAPPAVIATKAIRAADALLKGMDPFETIRRDTTAEALAMYQAIKPDVMAKLPRMTQVERIRYSAKLAAAGNIIDFGVSSEFDLKATLEETLDGDLAVDDSQGLYDAIVSSDTFLLVSDNAGEIVFDRFLLDEALRLGSRVYVSVKSGPILNDAMREDAVQAGIDRPIEIVETGSSSLGIILEECNQRFKDLLSGAGVVLSKGQANYETLDDADRTVFFILRAKCPIIAQKIGVPTGASVLMAHAGGNKTASE